MVIKNGYNKMVIIKMVIIKIL